VSYVLEAARDAWPVIALALLILVIDLSARLGAAITRAAGEVGR